MFYRTGKCQHVGIGPCPFRKTNTMRHVFPNGKMSAVGIGPCPFRKTNTMQNVLPDGKMSARRDRAMPFPKKRTPCRMFYRTGICQHVGIGPCPFLKTNTMQNVFPDGKTSARRDRAMPFPKKRTPCGMFCRTEKCQHVVTMFVSAMLMKPIESLVGAACPAPCR